MPIGLGASGQIRMANARMTPRALKLLTKQAMGLEFRAIAIATVLRLMGAEKAAASPVHRAGLEPRSMTTAAVQARVSLGACKAMLCCCLFVAAWVYIVLFVLLLGCTEV